MKSNIFKYVIILILFCSCKSENNEYYSFPNSVWNSQKKIKFDINTEDSTKIRLSNISIRHNTSYKYDSIIFFLHHSFKENIISTETIELLLAKNNGSWIGKGKGYIREFTTTISDPKLYQNGTHSFSLELAMREEASHEIEILNGISEISFYLSTENE